MTTPRYYAQNPYWNPPMRGRLMGELYRDSRVRIGFEYEWSQNLGYDPAIREQQLVSEIQAVLNNYLNDGVTFNNVRVTVQPPGFFSAGYITVEATTKTDLPNANVFGDMVEYGIRTYLLTIQITHRDKTLIDYTAPTPRPSPEAVYFEVGTELPPPVTATTTTTPTTTTTAKNTPPPPPKKNDGVSPLVWIGFGAVALILFTRD